MILSAFGWSDDPGHFLIPNLGVPSPAATHRGGAFVAAHRPRYNCACESATMGLRMTTDPIFAAIEAVKQAEAEYSQLEDAPPTATDDSAKAEAHFDQWSRIVVPPLNVLLDTLPTTPGGMRAKAEYLAQHLEGNGTANPPVITSLADVRRVFGPVSDHAIIATLVRDATVLSGAMFRPAVLLSRFHATMAHLLDHWSRWHATQASDVTDAAARQLTREQWQRRRPGP